MISHHEESCIISHLSRAVQTIQEKRKKKGTCDVRHHCQLRRPSHKSGIQKKLIWSIQKWYATMKNHVSFHTSHVLYRPYKKNKKKRDPLIWFLWKSLCTHGIDSYTQSSVTFWLTFYLQQNRRHMWYKLVVDHCSVLTRISQWVTCQSRVKKGERKTVEKMYAWKVNQKFGKVFLQFRSWSGQSHLDDVGWFCVDDE